MLPCSNLTLIDVTFAKKLFLFTSPPYKSLPKPDLLSLSEAGELQPAVRTSNPN